MTGAQERNRVLVVSITLLILAAGAYFPAVLLAPLPTVSHEIVRTATAESEAMGPALPTEGASAVALDAGSIPVAAGDSSPVPMAAIAKVITALVVLAEHPLQPGRSGPNIPVTDEDYQSYLTYSSEGTRAIQVVPGDTWTEREALHAMLIASSNNHAEMLARWSFGSLDGYLDAAADWLRNHGLTDISVADATGLDPATVGTASDLARLAAIGMADPFIAQAVGLDGSSTTRGTEFENTIGYRPGDGITGISRSYTDQAGVCLLFAVTMDVGGVQTPVYGAFVSEPSFDQLEADMDEFLESAASRLKNYPVIEAGTVVAKFTAPWGATATGLAKDSITAVGWGAGTADAKIRLTDFTTARPGQKVGTATVSFTEGEESTPVLLEGAITEPGPIWRMLHPGIMLPSFASWISGEST